MSHRIGKRIGKTAGRGTLATLASRLRTRVARFRLRSVTALVGLACLTAVVCLAGCSASGARSTRAETASRVLPGGAGQANDASVTVRTIQIAQICEAFPPTESEARRWVAARLSNNGLSPTRQRVDVGLELMRSACENPGAAARSGL